MWRKLQSGLSYANVMATLAVFIALGGVTYASVTANSVRSRHIVNGQVKTPDLGDKAVMSGKLASDSVKSSKVVDESLTGADIAEPTLSGVQGLERVEADSAENSVSPKQVTATCPAGKGLLGTGEDIFGGKSGTSPNVLTDVVFDFVIPGSTSVTVAAYETHAISTNWRVKAIAICATAP